MEIRKKLAREWLYFVAFFVLGFIGTKVIFYPTESTYLEKRHILYNAIQYDVNKWQRLRLRYEGVPGDTLRPYGTFMQFSRDLDDAVKRRILYDSISQGFDIGTYAEFENKVVQPSFLSPYKKLVSQMGNKLYWFPTWTSVLTLYIIFQFIRSILWSFKTLKQT
jgi:hypothetical protein